MMQKFKDKTHHLLSLTQMALKEAIQAIETALKCNQYSSILERAQSLYHSLQLCWDFIDAKSSMGFHSPQEAAQILAHAIDSVRQSQVLSIQTKSTTINSPKKDE